MSTAARFHRSFAPTIDGIRVRYVVMERFHVTRSYATGTGWKAQSRCLTQPVGNSVNRNSANLIDFKKLPGVQLILVSAGTAAVGNRGNVN